MATKNARASRTRDLTSLLDRKEHYPATVSPEPLYDPKMAKLKG